MNLNEALSLVDQLCATDPTDLRDQMRDVCQSVLGQMSARGLIDSNITIVSIKNELNRVINEKARQLVIQYQRILAEADVEDYKVLPQNLVTHAKKHLDACYSEACDQLAYSKGLVRTDPDFARSVQLGDDFQRMLQWVEPEIQILVVKLAKAATSHHAPLVGHSTVKVEGLIPMAFPCNVANARVRNLCDELKRLSPANYPNACAFTFRSFIEISVFCFLDTKGEIKKMHAAYLSEVAAKNAGRPTDRHVKPVADWTPDLSAMMKRLSTAGNGLLGSNHVIKALGKVIHDEQELFGLNLSTHNPTYHPAEARLRAAWQNLEEFFREVLA